MKCPHCGNSGISVWSKLMAGYISHARCQLCGEGSVYRGAWLVLYSVIAQILFVVIAVVSIGFKSWFLFFTGIAVLMAIPLGLPLKAINEKEIKNNKIVAYVFLGLVILGMIYFGVFDAKNL